MENLKCPQCGNALAEGLAVCGTCDREVKPEKMPGSKKLYAILAVLLVLVVGASLLIFSGLLPNPLKGGTTIAIVNGERISDTEVNRRLEIYKKSLRQADGTPELAGPEAKMALDDFRKQLVQIQIQEAIVWTESVKAMITVSPQELADRITTVKKSLNYSDKDFENFLRRNGTNLADYTRQIERKLLINKLIAKEMQEQGVTKEAAIQAIGKRAKVEVLAE
jgi:hypothetical protein